MSMSIRVEFSGDVDRLRHKDLAEKIIRSINDVVRLACDQADVPFDNDVKGYAEQHSVRVRQFLGSDPYDAPVEFVKARAEWGVHLDG